MVALYCRHSLTPVDPARVQGADTRRPYVVVSEPCCRCGGDGVWKGSYRGTCYRCGGHGQTPTDTRQVRVYTAEQNAKLDAAQATRQATAQAKRVARQAVVDAAQAQTAAAFDAAHPQLVLHAQDAPVVADLLARGRRFGSLSARQLALADSVIAQQVAARRRAVTSTYLGQVGERVTLDVVCVNVASYERSAFGSGRPQTVWVCSFETASGIVVVTKTPTLKVERATQGTLTGTVKAHTSYRDTLQTQLQRARFVARS